MKSININTLIAQQGISVKSDLSNSKNLKHLKNINNIFMKVLQKYPEVFSKCKGLKSVDISKYLFLSIPQLRFIMSKGNKQVFIRFDFTRKFLSLNNKTASEEDLTKVCSYFKNLGIEMIKQESNIWAKLQKHSEIKSEFESTLPSNIRANLSDLELSQYKKLKDKEGRYKEALGKLVFKLSKMFAPSKKAANDTNLEYQKAYDNLQLFFKNLLETNKKEILISNQFLSDRHSNTLIEMKVNSKIVSFIRKSNYHNDKVILSYSDKTIKLNGQIMTINEIAWFVEQCNQIGAGIKSKVLMIYEKK